MYGEVEKPVEYSNVMFREADMPMDYNRNPQEVRENDYIKTVLIDCDDVVFNLLPVWVCYLNEMTGKSYTQWDVIDWNISDIYEISREDALACLKDENFWSCVPIKEDALKYIPILSGLGYNIVFVTATDVANIKWKYDKLLKAFPWITPEQFIVCHNKQLLGNNHCVMVDDNPDNLIGGEYKQLLYTSPHNLWFEFDSCGGPTNIRRVHNWFDVVRAVIDYDQGNIKELREILLNDVYGTAKIPTSYPKSCPTK